MTITTPRDLPAHADACPTHAGRPVCTCDHPAFTTYNDGLFCVVVTSNLAAIGKQDEYVAHVMRDDPSFERVCAARDRSTIEALYVELVSAGAVY